MAKSPSYLRRGTINTEQFTLWWRISPQGRNSWEETSGSFSQGTKEVPFQLDGPQKVFELAPAGYGLVKRKPRWPGPPVASGRAMSSRVVSTWRNIHANAGQLWPVYEPQGRQEVSFEIVSRDSLSALFVSPPPLPRPFND